ncbi:MAG: FAD:protein FMN transferase [Acidobacteriota bacterium]|nr:FAD:protein FMN transferase [Acidobacteriota bacterium]
MKRAAFIVALALLSTAAEARTYQRGRFLMGTICEIRVPPGHDQQVEAAYAEARRIETMLSTWTTESELARVNRGEIAPSKELQSLLDAMHDWSRRTDGAFDPRVKALVDVWQIRGDGAVPSRDAIALARAQTQIEEGSFGKGYAIDRMLALLPRDEVSIDFGGQIAVRGTLRVDVADPADRHKPVLSLELRDESISTSSGSEKTFSAGGRTFSHILDPRTGDALPPRGSVSVIATDALTADILSTALYVMGEDDGLRWADANNIAAIFITSDRKVRLSAAAREHVRGLRVLDQNFSVKE